MAYDENESTWKAPPAPTPEQIDQWRRDPRNHITPGLQEIPVTPTRQINEIGRRPATIIRHPPSTTNNKTPVLH